MGNEELVAGQMTQTIEALRSAGLEASVSMRWVLMLMQFIGEYLGVIVWCVGGILFIQGHLEIGALVVFASLLGFVRGGFQAYFGAYDSWMQAKPGFEGVLAILDSEELEGFRQPRRAVLSSVRIEMEAVNFRYPGEDQPWALQHMNLTIPSGQRVGLVGETGAGKSTLLDLIMGFYTQTNGRLLYDGQPLEEIGLLTLRRSIAIMGQDAFLWNTTVRENIRYGRPTASNQEVEEAARRAQAHDFVLKLDHGYNTSCGERGGRLSTLRGVDRVLVFKDGTIVEDGSIAELINRPGGHYARLHALQSGVIENESNE